VVESFWAIPDIANVRTPLGILREQAAALTEKTHGVLVGIAEVRGIGNGDFNVQLDLSVPALNDYRYRILSYQQPVELYPGLLVDPKGTLVEVPDEETFVSAVKSVLSSERIKSVLTSLLAQTTDA
jgi:hypothetical protein